MERTTNSQYVKATGNKEALDSTIIYYYCSRSGYLTVCKERMRQVKTQGSSKLNTYCTSTIVLKRKDQTIFVQYCPTHYGHRKLLGHLRLTEKERLVIAGKLLKGITFERILDDIRNSLDTSVERIHLATRKDISNIQQAYGIQVEQYHNDDSISVLTWINEMKQNTPNPVLLYKQQGNATTSQCPNLTEKDFILVLQTPSQAEMLCKCGHNKTICVDDTHSTNSYDFNLTTVLVVDEFGEGYPTAWCISNRTDLIAMVYYFEAVQRNIGYKIVPKWVMTDDAPQFYSAWELVFGQGPQKLLCTWHVDRKWRANIRSKIQNEEVGALVYHNLRVLLDEKDCDKFEDFLQRTVQQLRVSTQTVEFEEYFTKFYVQRKTQWATCYRKKSGINTNMYVESFHRLIKYIYMRGRENKRIDKLLYILMKVSRDKAFERLFKLEKGKITGRVATIRRRHEESKNICSELLNQC